MASPDPTYDDGLVLVDQPLAHAGISHVAHVTFACADTASQDVQDIADLVQNDFSAAWKDLVDSNVVIGKPTVLRGDGTTTPGVAIGSLAEEPGLAVFDGPPPQVCALLKKITALGGRANRGRTYMPYVLPDADIHEDGSISGGTIVADINDRAAIMLSGLAADSLPMVICNREVDANPTPPPATYVSAYHTGATVTQYFLELVVATQRRRLVR